jgi:hypothetical protein
LQSASFNHYLFAHRFPFSQISRDRETTRASTT